MSTKQHQKQCKTCKGYSKMSSGEYAVKHILEKMELEYGREVYEFRNNEGNKVRFDFKVTYQGKTVYIEYRGKQHYVPTPVPASSNIDSITLFEEILENDKMKTFWCDSNDFSLLRIPYYKFGDIDNIVCRFICMNTGWGFETYDSGDEEDDEEDEDDETYTDSEEES
jgi:hypothetical protein